MNEPVSNDVPKPPAIRAAESATSTGRVLRLVGIVAVGVALVGILLGFRTDGGSEASVPQLHPEADEPPSNGVPRIVSYRELATDGLGVSREKAVTLADLVERRPGLFEPVTRTREMKLEAIADRAENRAFDGAPPVVPHPIAQDSSASCLACHGEGKLIGGRIATRMSHRTFTSCTQCHVDGTNGTDVPWATVEAQLAVENKFVGLYRSGPGSRAMPGAPPTIPHTTLLRSNCASCHGLVTRPGLRTTHPWLSSCTQCHVPSAGLDQVPFARVPRGDDDALR